jgi:hypothetical protein
MNRGLLIDHSVRRVVSDYTGSVCGMQVKHNFVLIPMCSMLLTQIYLVH